MTLRQTAPGASRTSAALNEDFSITGILVTGSLVLVAILLLGGYWLQTQRSEQAQQHRQAQMYDSYRDYTEPTAMPDAMPTLPAAFLEAQRTRETLLNHPAVTPGPGFHQQGVQSTGLAIINAIDQAKLLAP